MKAVKLSLVMMAAALLTIGLGGMAYAFHAGGVADCSGCHQMHNAPSTDFLLVKSDPSSTCLSCHMSATDTGPSSFHIATVDASMPPGTPPLQRGPGGDFGWLHKTYSWNAHGTPTTEIGDSHGHNIIAKDYGYAVDSINATAPGGTYLSANLSCVSCHDMHGEYRRDSTGNITSKSGGPIIGTGSAGAIPPAGQTVGVYRLLWGANPSTAGIAAFLGVPAAVAPSSYNRAESTQQTRVAYGYRTTNGHVTWGQWCGTCHAGMLGGIANHTHPVDQALSGTIGTGTGNYNMYVSSGNMTGIFAGFQLNQGPFTSLVPFILNQGDYATLTTYASSTGGATPLAGPSSADSVSCPSCHRAHASGFQHMLRWNTTTTFLTEVDSAGTVYWPGTDVPGDSTSNSEGRMKAETQAAYYDRDPKVFGAYQRSLCNKCHAKD
jgi:predicted CXXCH cytochrome family protein